MTKTQFAGVLMILLMATSAAAQEKPLLRWPTVTFVAAASADWVSTGLCARAGCHEQNPMLNWINHTPSMIATGAALDTAGLWTAHHLLHEKHPRLFAWGLVAASAFRVTLAVRNLQMAHGQRAYNRIRS